MVLIKTPSVNSLDCVDFSIYDAFSQGPLDARALLSHAYVHSTNQLTQTSSTPLETDSPSTQLAEQSLLDLSTNLAKNALKTTKSPDTGLQSHLIWVTGVLTAPYHLPRR